MMMNGRMKWVEVKQKINMATLIIGAFMLSGVILSYVVTDVIERHNRKR